MAEHGDDLYDVVIMGGGPAGSTLGALLRRRRPGTRVAIVEKEVFPRDHIGESFAHPLIPVLEESGALEKVMASDCWVKKYGGVFNWRSGTAPDSTLFDHANWAADGVYRWSMHVNRADFDDILLRHAADVGVDVLQGTKVSAFASDGAGCTLTLDDGRTLQGRYFVDASGRQRSMTGQDKRTLLSRYRNIAIWQHFTGGLPAQGLDGEWNPFREENLSPIGCFSFRNGWCWYIPVPKTIDGKRVLTHSIGIVTIPEVLKTTDYTDPATFLSAVQEVPLLRDLIADVTPTADRMLTATNYSMINDRFADLDGRWLLVGDAAYFVDPLFSSGVAFATAQASAAALLLCSSLDPDLPEQTVRDLWTDYDQGWHGMARTFALSIDQWYHAIGKNHPDSPYWAIRGSTVDLGLQENTFQTLLNTAFTPDLLQIMTEGRLDELDVEGPFLRAATLADPGEVDPDAIVALAPEASVRDSLALDIPGFKAFIPPPPFDLPPPVKDGIARYWTDPLAHADAAPGPHDAPIPCQRFQLASGAEFTQVVGVHERDSCRDLWTRLSAGPIRYRELAPELSPIQVGLFKRLMRAGVVVTQPAVPVAAAPASSAVPA